MNKTINEDIVSNCCKAELKVVSSDEGTSYFECTKCGKPTDMYSGDKVNASKPTEQKGWERQIEDLILDMLANPSYECNPEGSYIIDPIIKKVNNLLLSQRKELIETLEKLMIEEQCIFIDKSWKTKIDTPYQKKARKEFLAELRQKLNQIKK